MERRRGVGWWGSKCAVKERGEMMCFCIVLDSVSISFVIITVNINISLV